MRDLLKKAGYENRVSVASAATSTEELGCSVYPPAKRKLKEHGIDCTGKTARRVTAADYGKYDLIVGMDAANMRNMRRIIGEDRDGKYHLLLEFAGRDGDISDPWYSGDFDSAWDDIEAGCRALLRYLVKSKVI